MKRSGGCQSGWIDVAVGALCWSGEMDDSISPERNVLLELDRISSRRWRKLDAEVVEECLLVVLEVQSRQILLESRVHPVQPALIAWLDRISVPLCAR